MPELPQLTGTPKQKKWATIIRARHVAEMRRWGPGGWGDDRQLRAFAAILANAEATWWIHRRGQSLDDLLQIAGWELATASREKRHASGPTGGERRIQDSTPGADGSDQ